MGDTKLSLDIEATVEKLKIEDGDLLIVTVPEGTKTANARQLRKGLETMLVHMGVHAHVAVVGEGMSLSLAKNTQLNDIFQMLDDLREQNEALDARVDELEREQGR